MIEKIVKTLSDTELVVIAKELDNSSISNESIVQQLLSKSDDYIDIQDEIHKHGSLELLVGYLCLKVSVELADRLIGSYK